MNNKNLWQALAKKYLSSNEIQNTISAEDKKRMVNIIKMRLFDDLWIRMEKFGETKPPFIELPNSKFLCFDRKTTIIETDEINHAKLETNDDGFLLKVNKLKNETQKRTLIAHEIGHTFFYDVDNIPVKPFFTRDRVGDYFEGNRTAIYSKEEAFVYEIARHVLVPSKSLERILPPTPSLDAFLESCGKNQFHISKDLMAKRLYWDTHYWVTEFNYWPHSILVLYPASKIEKNEILAPLGNTEIFKGKDKAFKKIDIKMKIWDRLIPMIRLTLNSPNRTIFSKNLDERAGFHGLRIDRTTLLIEMKYVPSDQRIYILIFPQHAEKMKKDLSDFMMVDN